MVRRKRVQFVGIGAVFLTALAVAIWLLAFDAGDPVEELSAAETVRQACDTLAEEDHDILVAITREDARIVQTWHTSGPDFRAELVAYSLPDETLLGKSETILKDGVWYERKVESSDSSAPLGEWKVLATGYPPSGPGTPCFGAGDTSSAREASSSGRSSSSAEAATAATTTATAAAAAAAWRQDTHVWVEDHRGLEIPQGECRAGVSAHGQWRGRFVDLQHLAGYGQRA